MLQHVSASLEGRRGGEEGGGRGRRREGGGGEEKEKNAAFFSTAHETSLHQLARRLPHHRREQPRGVKNTRRQRINFRHHIGEMKEGGGESGRLAFNAAEASAALPILQWHIHET